MAMFRICSGKFMRSIIKLRQLADVLRTIRAVVLFREVRLGEISLLDGELLDLYRCYSASVLPQ